MNTKLLSLLFIFVLCGCSSDDKLPETPDGENPENPNNVESYFDREYVIINGLKWDTKNLDGYYTYEEAAEIAEKQGKRLPTIDELLGAVKTYGCIFGEYGSLQGWWTGKDLGEREYSEESLFLPITGHVIVYSDDDYRYYDKDECAYLLSSTYKEGHYGGYGVLYIYNGANTAYYKSSIDTIYKFPVRLVQDIK